MMTAWINMGMSVTDTWMVSRLGPEAMAAVAVSSDVYSIVLYFFSGVLGGLSPALAIAVAGHAQLRVRQLWTASWVMYVLCPFAALPTLWFAPAVLNLLGVPAVLLESGHAYTRLLVLCLAPQLAICIMRSVLVAHHRPQLFFRVALCALPLNALLDGMLIHGIGPIDAMGVEGAGLATLLTSVSMAVAIALLLRRESFAIEARLLLSAAGQDRAALASDCMRAWRIGLPIGATALAEVGIYLGATVFIAVQSIDAVAAHTLTMRLAGIAYALPFSLAQVAALRVAQTGGTPAGGAVIRTLAQLAWFSALVLGLSLTLLAEPVARLLNDGSDLGASSARTAYVLILLLATTELVESFTAVATGVLRGREDTFIPMVCSVFAYWFISLPAAFWLTPQIAGDAESVWLALLIGMCISAALLAVRLHRVFAPRHRSVDA